MAKKLSESGKKQDGIHPEVLRSLIKKCDAIKGEMDETRGELGAAVKDAEEAHGVHRRAFKLALSLNRMEEAARSDFLRALDDYRGKLGFDDQADMFDDAPGDGAAAGAGDDGDEALRRLQQGAKAEEEAKVAENTAALKRGIKKTGDGAAAPVH